MKCSLFSAALLSALSLHSACAGASNVELYGVLDYGITWQKSSAVNGMDESTVQMVSGQYIGSRFGIKATEELADSIKVGVVLENGFGSDTGAMSQGGRLFGRDARLFIDGSFGYLSFGRMGSMVGGNGPYARFGHVVSPFSCGWGDLGGHLQVVSLGYEFIDNAVAYTTPKFAGVDATVQYSFGTDTTKFNDGSEGKSSVERMLSGAVRFQNEALMVAAGIETINYAQPAADLAKLDDAISYNLGANYDAGWAKLYFYAQLFDNYTAAARTTTFSDPSGVDGYGINIGFDAPAFGGTVKASFGYGDFEASASKDFSMKTTQAALGYLYLMSRLTSIYSAVNWIRSDYSAAYEAQHPQAKEDVYAATVGIMHKF